MSVIRKSIFKVKMIMHGNSEYICETCGAVFNLNYMSESQLRDHLAIFDVDGVNCMRCFLAADEGQKYEYTQLTLFSGDFDNDR